jgi:outer membrane biosynthesis protein TonB
MSSRTTTDAFGFAMAASVLVHLATFGVLFAAGWAPGSGTGIWSSQIDGPLEVALATMQVPADKSNSGAVAIETASANAVRMPMSQELAMTAPDVRRQTAPESLSEPGRPGRGRMPRVIVDNRVPRAGFEDAFDGGPLAEFPSEVESPVSLPGKLEVPYPRTALEARREGSVFAWAIVDQRGVVEQATIVAGQGDFNEAVKATLAKTRLIPARDGGQNVRYYVLLKFEFRIESPGAAATASR